MTGLVPDAVSVVGAHGGLTVVFFCSGIQLYVLLRPYLCFIIISFLYLDLYVLVDDSWIS